MAWTIPMTAVANDIFSSADFNTHIRDNLNATEAAIVDGAGQYFVATGENALAKRSPASARVDTSQSYAGIAWGNLTTQGPSVTVTTGTSALVHIAAEMQCDTDYRTVRATVVVSGATTIDENDHPCQIIWDGAVAGNGARLGTWTKLGLNSGSNTFKMRYSTGGDTVTGTWQYRHIIVIPL